MEIWRQGANRKTGWSVIRSKKTLVVGMEGDQKLGTVVTLTLKTTNDPTQEGQYDHEVRLSFSDIAKLLEELSDNGIANYRDEILEGFSESVRSLNRLLNAASGVMVNS